MVVLTVVLFRKYGCLVRCSSDENSFGYGYSSYFTNQYQRCAIPVTSPGVASTGNTKHSQWAAIRHALVYLVQNGITGDEKPLSSYQS